MKKILTVIMVLGMLGAGTTVSADVKKGQKLYLKKVKSKCNMTGTKFAGMNTTDEWEDLMREGTIINELTEMCPKGKKMFESEKFQEKVLPHLMDFSKKYSSDSGNVPSCG